MTHYDKVVEAVREIVEFICEGSCPACGYYNGNPITERGGFCEKPPDKAVAVLNLTIDGITIKELIKKWLAKEVVELDPDQSFPEFMTTGSEGWELVKATRQSVYDANFRKIIER